MSQVIVTNDELRLKRESSGRQERAIDTESLMTHWRRNDITKSDPILRLIGYLVLPIVGLWSLIGGLIALTLFVLRSVFNFIGRIIGGTRSLITGAPVGGKSSDSSR